MKIYSTEKNSLKEANATKMPLNHHRLIHEIT